MTNRTQLKTEYSTQIHIYIQSYRNLSINIRFELRTKHTNEWRCICISKRAKSFNMKNRRTNLRKIPYYILVFELQNGAKTICTRIRLAWKRQGTQTYTQTQRNNNKNTEISVPFFSLWFGFTKFTYCLDLLLFLLLRLKYHSIWFEHTAKIIEF